MLCPKTNRPLYVLPDIFKNQLDGVSFIGVSIAQNDLGQIDLSNSYAYSLQSGPHTKLTQNRYGQLDDSVYYPIIFAELSTDGYIWEQLLGTVDYIYHTQFLATTDDVR